jgi:hypothetical protein
MKIELFNLSDERKRILFLFDTSELSPEDKKINEYLHANDLEPKHQYSETRDGKEYLVYYFGHCYLDEHLDNLSTISGVANPKA